MNNDAVERTKPMRVKCIRHRGADLPGLNFRVNDTAEMTILKIVDAIKALEKKTDLYIKLQS